MRSRMLYGAILVVLFAASASAVVVPVTPSHLAGWLIPGGPPTCDGSGFPTSANTFTLGPGTPPLGSGSLTLTIGANPSGFAVDVNPTFAGVRLSDITQLRYSTYVTSAVSLASSQQAPRLFLYLDLNGDQTQFEQIVFEPRLQTGAHPGDAVPVQGPVVTGQWQTWDALAGGWWDLNPFPTPEPVFRLSTIAAAHPNARIAGGFNPGVALLAGCDAGDWTNFSGSVDNLTISVNAAVTQFNFEPDSSIPASQPATLLLLAATLAAIAAARLRS